MTKISREEGRASLAQVPVQAQCLICGRTYILPEPGEFATVGRHFWACSDECQEKFRCQGGIHPKSKAQTSEVDGLSEN